MNKLNQTIVSMVLSLWSFNSISADLSVDEIIKNSNKASYYAGDDGRSDARMMIVDKSGNKQLRQFVILRKDKEDQKDQDFLVVFSRPSDVRGTVFLVNKHVETDDDRWLYLPGLDLEKRISAGDKRTSFVGSDFFYEDVSGRNPNNDTHEILKSEADSYVIQSTPKDLSSVEFSHYQMQIDKTSFIPMKIEYFKGDKIYRKVEVVDVQVIQGHPTVLKSKASNLDSEGYTLMEFRRPAYDIGLPESVFSSRSLRNPPKEWISAK